MVMHIQQNANIDFSDRLDQIEKCLIGKYNHFVECGNDLHTPNAKDVFHLNL